MHWIIGTAGHIDHGKTSLIKALTGLDTDRLPEEKERGISIDLGFAHLDLADGTSAGVVDVPGHERFIRNMLAGAHGMDLVLFTVAADDGVMPQTEEHLDILHFLGVRQAIFVITKADLASEDRVAEVADEIRVLAAGTSLDGSPIVPFSALSNEGLARLRDEIAAMLRSGRKAPPAGYFRLPVDRAFVSQGHGLIVTGTAVSGEVRRTDSVRCLPGDLLLRVRGIEVHGRPVDVGTFGQRIALNLTGTDRADIVRGDVICDEKITRASTRFDARLELRPSAAGGIRSHQQVRVHVGTAERLGKVVVLGSRADPRADRIAPKESAYCQVLLKEPLLVMRGDRFIVRDETAQRTLGGGVVIHSAAAKHRRSDPALPGKLHILERGDDAAVVEALIGDSGEFAVSLAGLAQLLNRREDDVRALLPRLSGVHLFTVDGQTHGALERACLDMKARLLETTRAWHAAHPLSPGLEIEEARAGLPGRIPARIFRLLVDELSADRSLVREGSVLRLPGHRIEVRDDDAPLVERIRQLLEKTPLGPPDIGQLGASLGVERQKLAELLRAMEKRGTIVRVAQDLYFLSEHVQRVKDDLSIELTKTGSITAAQFRDRYQTSRKFAIPLLEYFDRDGLTVRIGEARRLKRARVTDTA